MNNLLNMTKFARLITDSDSDLVMFSYTNCTQNDDKFVKQMSWIDFSK